MKNVHVTLTLLKDGETFDFPLEVWVVGSQNWKSKASDSTRLQVTVNVNQRECDANFTQKVARAIIVSLKYIKDLSKNIYNV